MSEKRFEWDRLGIFDNKTNHYYYKTFDNEEVVDLLNEQQAEIDYLKDLISAMKSDIKNAMRMVSRWNDE